MFPKTKKKKTISYDKEFVEEHFGLIPQDRLEFLRSGQYKPPPKGKKAAEYEREQDEYQERLKYYDMGDFSILERQQEKEQRKAKWGIYISFAANVLLTVAKVIVLVWSGSIAILASLLDSILDLVSGSIIFISSRLQIMGSKEFYKYPVGKRRLETITVIVFSVAMFTATTELLIQSIERFTSEFSLSFDLTSIGIVTGIIVVKFGLWLYCRSSKVATLKAIAMDHRNDIFTNAVGIFCGVLGYYFYNDLDPIGGLLLGLFIMYTWFNTGIENVKLMMGISADPNVLSMLTYIAYTHDDRVVAVDTVRAYHVSERIIAELDIILPEDMTLKEAHDIGESLQQKIEKLPNVERAFVHLDFEFDHRHYDEHPTLKTMQKSKKTENLVPLDENKE